MAPSVIRTPQEFKQAIEKREVAEVSPKLFGTLTDAFYGTLTQPIRRYSWTSGSSNLYQFLVLNQRYPQRLQEGNSRYFSDNGVEKLSQIYVDAVVSEETMNGMARIVGVPGSVKDWKALGINNDYNPANSVYSFNSQLVVYKQKDNENTLGAPEMPKMPTWRNLIEIVNEQKPDGSNPIPSLVTKNLKQAYSATSKGKKTPVQVFSELTGIDEIPSKSFNTQLVKNNKATNQYYVDGNIGISDATKAKIVKEVFKALDQNRGDNISYGDLGSGTKEFSKRFFQKFADEYINKIDKFSTFNNKKVSNVEVLTIGVRIFLDQVYGASPYFTGFGFGYMLGKNPLVGKRNILEIESDMWENFTEEEDLIEAFTGQEYFVNNTQWWSKTGGKSTEYYYGKSDDSGVPYGVSQGVDVQVFGSKVKRDQDLIEDPNTVENGRFEYTNMNLRKGNLPYKKFTRSTYGGGIDDYKYRYVATSNNVLFTTSKQATFTHDVIDATEIKNMGYKDVADKPFHREYILSLSEDKSERLVDQNSMLYNVMGNDYFAFISRSSGGIDRVYGSKFNDIITGSPAGTPSGGQMHVEAGGGDDIINTGRGASLIYTGDGEDRIFVNSDELFGDSILMDFDSNKDKIYIPKSLESNVDGFNTNTLTISTSATDLSKDYDTKSFILSGESSETWSTSNISYVQL